MLGSVSPLEQIKRWVTSRCQERQRYGRSWSQEEEEEGGAAEEVEGGAAEEVEGGAAEEVEGGVVFLRME